MRHPFPAILATISLVLAPPLAAQDMSDLPEQFAGLDEDALIRLIMLAAESEQSVAGLEPYACPVDESPSEIDADAAESDEAISPPVQDYAPSPALWRISDEDTVIHLFGTFHVLPEGFQWRTTLLDTVIAQADEVVFETREEDMSISSTLAGEAADEGEDAAQAVPMSSFEAQIFDLVFSNLPDRPIFSRISEANKPKLAKLVLDAGMGLEDANLMPPMLLMMTVGVAQALEAGSVSELGVESVLHDEFANSARPISSIEDPAQVLANLLKVDQEALIASLEADLDEWDPCKPFVGDASWEMEHAWAKGDVEKLLIGFDENDRFSQLFNKVLLADRNTQWAAWVDDRMDRPGNLLLAVGAGHMAGPDSLVLMLEAKGFSVERIQ